MTPRANVNLWLGRIASRRGDKKSAERLFLKATTEHPKDAPSAFDYLVSSVGAIQPPARAADISTPVAKRFPNDGGVQSIHAVALYKDERFAEAAQTLKEARDLDRNIVQFLGDNLVKEIENGRYIAPNVQRGMSDMKRGTYAGAITAFRQALADDPQNGIAAEWLTRAILKSLKPQRQSALPSSALASAAAREIDDLGRRFPNDVEIQAGRAVVLYMADRYGEAAQALERIERLGGRTDKLLDDTTTAAIRRSAD